MLPCATFYSAFISRPPTTRKYRHLFEQFVVARCVKKKRKGIDTVRATRPLPVNVDATGKRKVPIELEGKRPSYTNVI